MRLSRVYAYAAFVLSSPASSVISLASAVPLASSCGAKPPAFFLAGDSTTAPAGGWGDAFLSLLKSPAWGTNYAHSGRTTVSFVKGGDWAKVIAAVKNSTANYECLVTIQFGHNDQKTAANISLAQFQANLQSFAGEVKAAGGTPILVTPLTRRSFTSSHNADDSLHDQRIATIAAATGSQTRYIDLNAASMAYVNAIGSTAAQEYNLKEGDKTHLNPHGSAVFAQMVADLLLGQKPVITAGGKCDAAGNDECLEKAIQQNRTMSCAMWSGVTV